VPKIKLFANLRKVAGMREASIKGASIGAAVDELVNQIPALAGYLFENGQIRPHVIITLNGHPTTNVELPVTEEDILAIFPPIAGG
jgi:MoaD family protein